MKTQILEIRNKNADKIIADSSSRVNNLIYMEKRMSDILIHEKRRKSIRPDNRKNSLCNLLNLNWNENNPKPKKSTFYSKENKKSPEIYSSKKRLNRVEKTKEHRLNDDFLEIAYNNIVRRKNLKSGTEILSPKKRPTNLLSSDNQNSPSKTNELWSLNKENGKNQTNSPNNNHKSNKTTIFTDVFDGNFGNVKDFEINEFPEDVLKGTSTRQNDKKKARPYSSKKNKLILEQCLKTLEHRLARQADNEANTGNLKSKANRDLESSVTKSSRSFLYSKTLNSGNKWNIDEETKKVIHNKNANSSNQPNNEVPVKVIHKFKPTGETTSTTISNNILMNIENDFLSKNPKNAFELPSRKNDFNSTGFSLTEDKNEYSKLSFGRTSFISGLKSAIRNTTAYTEGDNNDIILNKKLAQFAKIKQASNENTEESPTSRKPRIKDLFLSKKMSKDIADSDAVNRDIKTNFIKFLTVNKQNKDSLPLKEGKRNETVIDEIAAGNFFGIISEIDRKKQYHDRKISYYEKLKKRKKKRPEIPAALLNDQRGSSLPNNTRQNDYLKKFVQNASKALKSEKEMHALKRSNLKKVIDRSKQFTSFKPFPISKDNEFIYFNRNPSIVNNISNHSFEIANSLERVRSLSINRDFDKDIFLFDSDINGDLEHMSPHVNKGAIKYKIPMMRSLKGLNNYFLRDFKIGQDSNPIESSKRNFLMAYDFFQGAEEKKKQELLRELQEKQSEGAVIYEDELDNDYHSADEPETKQMILDEISASNENTLRNRTQSRRETSKNASVSYAGVRVQGQGQQSAGNTATLYNSGNLYQSTHKYNNSLNEKILNYREAYQKFDEEMDKRHRNKVRQESKLMCDLINDISVEYKHIPESEGHIGDIRVNQNNIKRVLRVKTIIKEKRDIGNDNIGTEDIRKFKRELEENKDMISNVLRWIGPPKFMRRNFKKITNNKYRIINGKMMGCKV